MRGRTGTLPHHTLHTRASTLPHEAANLSKDLAEVPKPTDEAAEHPRPQRRANLQSRHAARRRGAQSEGSTTQEQRSGRKPRRKARQHRDRRAAGEARWHELERHEDAATDEAREDRQREALQPARVCLVGLHARVGSRAMVSLR